MPEHKQRDNGGSDPAAPTRPKLGDGRVLDHRERGQDRTVVGDDALSCPICGQLVIQVSSATLELALWQHQNWVCKKKGYGWGV